MKKIFNKHILLLVSAFSLLFASCSGLNTDGDSYDDNDGKPSIRIVLDGAGAARTALPELFGTTTGIVTENDVVTDYTSYKWVLESRPAGETWSNDWNGAVIRGEWTSYQSMINDTIGLSEGTWNFRLTATQTLSDEDSTTVTQYRGYGTILSGEGESATVIEDIPLGNGSVAHRDVSFAMNLIKYDVTADYVNGENTAKGLMSLVLNYTSSSVAKVECDLCKVTADDSLPTGFNYTTVATTKETQGLIAITSVASASGLSYTFTASAIPVGAYTAVFTFYAAGNNDGEYIEIGKWLDDVNIVADNVSKDEILVESLDDVYTVTFVRAVGATTAKSYSRFSRHSGATFSLPVAVKADNVLEEDNTDYVFCGWYTSDEYSGTPKTSIDTKTERQNITLYGRYVKPLPELAESALSLSFKKETVEGQTADFNMTPAHVGNTISVSVSGTSDSAATYKWQYSSDNSSWSEISGATSASFLITGAYSGKYLKASVKNSYSTDSASENTGLAYHTVDTNPDAVGIVYEENDSAVAISPGALNTSDSSLQYSGNVIYGNKPQKANLILKNLLKDVYGNVITEFDKDFDEYPALTVTKELDVKFTVTGYNPQDAAAAKVIVPVKYATPDASVVTFGEPNPDGKVHIDNDESKEFYDFIVGESSAVIIAVDGEYKYAVADEYTDNLTWYDLKEPGTQINLLTSKRLWIYKEGTATTATVKEGEILASEPFAITVEDKYIKSPVDARTKTLTLKSSTDINNLFTKNFKSATAFTYTNDSAPSSAITISDVDSAVLVKAWMSNKTLYVHAVGYSGETGKTESGEYDISKDFRMPLLCDAEDLFKGMSRLVSVDLSGFNTKSITYSSDSSEPTETYCVTDMSGMFQDCTSLESITFGHYFDASAVTTMAHMLEGTSITEFNIADLIITVPNTGTDSASNPALTNMESMFAN